MPFSFKQEISTTYAGVRILLGKIDHISLFWSLLLELAGLADKMKRNGMIREMWREMLTLPQLARCGCVTREQSS
jgi:hypothetical protein